ncbi:metallophosphoesterase family protein [Rhodopila sp.]|jgi:hypothetical protein|uniref:metallophosphoesterase family protein n=1 Tax=Rhodopila sp. TaxID=2480087 RepID=UPI002C072F7F|nr:metallophosphoesterase [Rhodopila sp.]HVZ06492.1 metallophosphoesterase [Rhodopila sp.]
MPSELTRRLVTRKRPAQDGPAQKQPARDEVAPGRPLVFAGDPHRNFSPILRACAALPPGTLVLLGDCDLPAPLAEVMAPVLRAGWDVRWILGNHDTETEAAYDHLTSAEGDLGLKVATIGGLRVAGLPGVFRPRVWVPRPGEGPPSFQTRAAFQAALRPGEAWRGGLPLWHRDTIFPEDFRRLGAERFDILVSHEAPSSHPHGHAVIDDLAAHCGARLIIHGHHHQSYDAVLPNGVRVKGLAIAETWIAEGIPDGVPDER